jgi:mRNA-degrading endonuclease YafQ of YafQ-DinJ toxin-antitoxin module
MRRILLRSPAFGRDMRNWLKSHPNTAAKIEAALEQLSADAAHPSLRTHKLRGPLAGCWACSDGYDLRVVFEYTQHEGAEAILLLALGTHDEVY